MKNPYLQFAMAFAIFCVGFVLLDALVMNMQGLSLLFHE